MSKHNLSISSDINSDYDESMKRRKFVSSYGLDMVDDDQDMDTNETNSLVNAEMQSTNVLSNSPLPDILVNTVKNITYKKIPSNLSSGGNGIVALYQTIDLDNPCKVVIKRIDNDSASSETDIDLINNKFSKLTSKHIIQCKDYFEMDGYFYFVMDYCGYNLKEYILHKGTKIITPFFILQLIVQIITALNYLNEQQLFHGDLKLENIFVSDELNEILKTKKGYLYGYVFILGDLGSVNEGNRFISRDYNNLLQDRNFSSYSSFTCGTNGYQAPELINGNCLLTEKIDIWSLGITLLILLSLLDNFNNNDIILNARKYLFYYNTTEKEHKQYFNNILTHTDNTLNEITNTLGNDNDWKFVINNIITPMLDKNSKTRISCKEINERLFGRETFGTLIKNFDFLTRDLYSINLIVEAVSVFKRNFNKTRFLKDIKFVDDRNIVLKLVSNNGELLKNCFDHFKNDKEIVLAAISNYPNYYYKINIKHELKYDKDIVLLKCKKEKEALNCLEDLDYFYNEIEEFKLLSYNTNLEQLLNDKEFILELLRKRPEMYSYINDKFKKDKEIIDAIYWQIFLKTELMEDKELVLEVVKIYPYMYNYINDKFKKDKAIILTAFGNASEYNTFYCNFWENENFIDIINANKDVKFIVSEFDTPEYMKEVINKLLKNNNTFELIYTYDESRQTRQSRHTIHKEEGYFQKYFSTKFWIIKHYYDRICEKCFEFAPVDLMVNEFDELDTDDEVIEFNELTDEVKELFFKLLEGFSIEKSICVIEIKR